MNAAESPSSKGVSMQQASDWVQERLERPGEIFSICLEFGINSTMLAEIVQPFVPGVGPSDVEAFFTQLGFDALQLRNAGALGPVPMPTPVDPGGPVVSGLLPPEYGALLSLVSLNDNGGALSNASLREASLAQTPQGGDYWSLFSPAQVGGHGDGTWSTSELGFTGLGPLPATAETLESLFYGTVIRLVRSIDQQEVSQLDAFVQANAAALDGGNAAAVSSLIQQLSQVFSTPASVPVVPDQELAAFLPFATASAVQLVGSGNPDLFGSFLGFVL